MTGNGSEIVGVEAEDDAVCDEAPSSRRVPKLGNAAWLLEERTMGAVGGGDSSSDALGEVDGEAAPLDPDEAEYLRGLTGIGSPFEPTRGIEASTVLDLRTETPEAEDGIKIGLRLDEEDRFVGAGDSSAI